MVIVSGIIAQDEIKSSVSCLYSQSLLLLTHDYLIYVFAMVQMAL